MLFIRAFFWANQPIAAVGWVMTVKTTGFVDADDADEAARDAPHIVDVDGRSISTGNHFFRGEGTIFHPGAEDVDQPEGLEAFIFRGWIPDGHAIADFSGLAIAGGKFSEKLFRYSESVANYLGDGDLPELLTILKARHREIEQAQLLFLDIGPQASCLRHAEVLAALGELAAWCREVNPDLHIVLTVSPGGSGQGQPDPVQASANRATIRSAVGEALGAAWGGNISYFPYMEMALLPSLDAFEGDRRAIREPVSHLGCLAFEYYFLKEGRVSQEALQSAYAGALESGRSLDLPAFEAVPDALERHYLSGWLPAAPFIDADTTLIAFGSCFASNISIYLNKIGYNVATRRDTVAYTSRLADGIVNVHAIRQQFEWAWEGRVPTVPLWHDYDAREFGYDEAVRIRTREIFDAADVFIITLGLSEVWYDDVTGEVFWRAVPASRYDSARHKFRALTQAETLENIRAIVGIIRRFRPAAKIIFTLSPIPLAATFRGRACIPASAASKATLRSAVAEFFAEADEAVFYFPAYEIITTAFRRPCALDLRHPHRHLIFLNMKLFEFHYCRSTVSRQEIESGCEAAMAIDREIVREGVGGPLYTAMLASEQEWQGDDTTVFIQRLARARARLDAQRERAEMRARNEEARDARRAALRESRALSRSRTGIPEGPKEKR